MVPVVWIFLIQVLLSGGPGREMEDDRENPDNHRVTQADFVQP